VNERSVGERNRGRRRDERCRRYKKKKRKNREDVCGGEGEEREKIIFLGMVKIKNIILMK
jgi:hypothetical protein